jgi:hypothetical protein
LKLVFVIFLIVLELVTIVRWLFVVQNLKLVVNHVETLIIWIFAKVVFIDEVCKVFFMTIEGSVTLLIVIVLFVVPVVNNLDIVVVYNLIVQVFIVVMMNVVLDVMIKLNVKLFSVQVWKEVPSMLCLNFMLQLLQELMFLL